MKNNSNLPLWIAAVEVLLIIAVVFSSSRSERTSPVAGAVVSKAPVAMLALSDIIGQSEPARLEVEESEQLKNFIRRDLVMDPTTTVEPVNVEVAGGRIILSGIVSDMEAMQRVHSIAGKNAAAGLVESRLCLSASNTF